jgi:hypothetical protein
MNTDAPCAHIMRTIASPMPEAPPVMSAVFPATRPAFSGVLFMFIS